MAEKVTERKRVRLKKLLKSPGMELSIPVKGRKGGKISGAKKVSEHKTKG